MDSPRFSSVKLCEGQNPTTHRLPFVLMPSSGCPCGQPSPCLSFSCPAYAPPHPQ